MTMETRRFGRLGHLTSVLVYGAASLADVPDDVADRSIELALAAGINSFDTAFGYGDSEFHLGRWMDRIRDRIFLATKTGDRTAIGAYDGIRRSLERLRVDRIDLIQLHAIGDLEDLDLATRPDGAVEGARRARDEGLVGGIGITGHGMDAPATHLEALRRFPFDAVMTPWNYRLAQDERYRHEFDALVEATEAQDVGLRVIKAGARNLWKAGEDRAATTWYEPLDEQPLVTAAVRFALARPEIAGICTAGDVRLLPLFVRAEREMRSGSLDDAVALLQAVPEYASPFVAAKGRTAPDWLRPSHR
jgi:aryl-alcohol dehydrogenase-like predicted oxidoreductase